MKTIEITKTNAIKAYASASKSEKKLLETLFGEEIFSQKITDRVKSFEDALNELKPLDENEKILLQYNGPNRTIISAQAQFKLSIIAQALNEGWQPDWTNHNQYKYYPWFEKKKPGSAFSFYDCDCLCTAADVGSRLCFKTSELAKYAGEQFIDLYNDLMEI